MACHAIMARGTGDLLLVVQGASFSRALEHAARSGAGLAGADLKGRDLAAAFLYRAGLAGADLTGSDLAGAYLRESDLRRAGLRGAGLKGAFLKGADLRGADLRGADLTRADLRGAALAGADFGGARLDRARLDGAILDWRSSAVAAELLHQDLSVAQGGPLVVFDLAFHGDGPAYSWLDRLLAHDAKTEALAALARRVRPGDDAPRLLRRLAAQIPARQAARGAA